MKKNGEYVGVDEKFVPKDEKYVDNETNEELKGVINDGIKSATGYVSDKDNQEKIKKAGKKGLKIAKGIGIGYLALICFIVIVFVTIFTFGIVNMIKTSQEFDKTEKQTAESSNSFDTQAFNGTFEQYNGTQPASFVKDLLENVVTNNKTKPNHIITIVTGDQSMTAADEITTYKKSLADKEYEVSLDYDANGYVNKITIE
ncbi:MAG: hypothetical protein EOM74_05585 [Methanomicrobia archaeon]|nr:hypothetical protein [Methanomicrobia archaeon]